MDEKDLVAMIQTHPHVHIPPRLIAEQLRLARTNYAYSEDLESIREHHDFVCGMVADVYERNIPKFNRAIFLQFCGCK